MKRVILPMFALFAICSSCNSENSGEVTPPASVQPLEIDPLIQSRAINDSFEVGDQIALTVVMSDESLYVDNHLMSYDGATFSGELNWYDDELGGSTLVAYYPYTEGETTPTSFSIQTDQSSIEAYCASDLMIALKSDVTPSSNSILMTFDHILCSIVASVDNKSDQGVKSITIGGVYPTATLDVATKSIEVDNTSSMVEISTAVWSDGSYRALFAPQEAALSFEVTLDDGSTVISQKSSQEFELGLQYEASILILNGDVSITLSGGIEGWGSGDDIEIVTPSIYEEFDSYFVYDGVSYNFKTFDNGLTVMTDNMRYIPQNMSPSADPSDGNGLWYTYSLSADPTDASADYIATALTDDESVAKYGYLYNYATAFGVDVTGDNYDQFEGTQGICPTGWHIPTQEEWFSLCGDGYGSSDNSSAPFYDSSVGYGSIQRANELGFNHNYAGSIANDRYTTSYVASDYTDSDSSSETIVGNNSLTYYMSSTAQTYWPTSDKACYYALYTSHASAYTAKGCISVMLSYEPYGMSLRCVKDR